MKIKTFKLHFRTRTPDPTYSGGRLDDVFEAVETTSKVKAAEIGKTRAAERDDEATKHRCWFMAVLPIDQP